MQLRKMKVRISLFLANTECIDFLCLTYGRPHKAKLRGVCKKNACLGQKRETKEKACEKEDAQIQKTVLALPQVEKAREQTKNQVKLLYTQMSLSEKQDISRDLN